MTTAKFYEWAKDHFNFMTPNIIDVKINRNEEYIELSCGKGLENQDIYGVSLFVRDGDAFKGVHDGRAKCFDDRREAQKYFKQMCL